MHWELLWHLNGAPETDDSNLEFSISFWNKLSSSWQRSQELSLHPVPTSHLHTQNLTLLFSRGKWYDDNGLYFNSLLWNRRLGIIILINILKLWRYINKVNENYTIRYFGNDFIQVIQWAQGKLCPLISSCEMPPMMAVPNSLLIMILHNDSAYEYLTWSP